MKLMSINEYYKQYVQYKAVQHQGYLTYLSKGSYMSGLFPCYTNAVGDWYGTFPGGQLFASVKDYSNYRLRNKEAFAVSLNTSLSKLSDKLKEQNIVHLEQPILIQICGCYGHSYFRTYQSIRPAIEDLKLIIKSGAAWNLIKTKGFTPRESDNQLGNVNCVYYGPNMTSSIIETGV